MTGAEFSAAMRTLNLTQKQLAKHWGLARTTIGRVSGLAEVPTVYADAIRYLLVSRSVDDLQAVVGGVMKGTAP